MPGVEAAGREGRRVERGVGRDRTDRCQPLGRPARAAHLVVEPGHAGESGDAVPELLAEGVALDHDDGLGSGRLHGSGRAGGLLAGRAAGATRRRAARELVPQLVPGASGESAVVS